MHTMPPTRLKLVPERKSRFSYLAFFISLPHLMRLAADSVGLHTRSISLLMASGLDLSRRATESTRT